MEFQPTPGTYAPVDPFKPSIAFSIKKTLGSQRAPPDDMDLDSPPRVPISTRRHGDIRPPTNTAVGPRYEAPRAAWRIQTASPSPRFPPSHEPRTPRFELHPDNWIPQTSDSPIPLHDSQHLQGHLQSHWSDRPPAERMEATSTNSRQRNASRYQHSEFRSRRRSRSSSDRNRGRLRSRSPPSILGDSSLRSPSVERNRERSSSQRRRRSGSRCRSPVRSRSRRRSRSTRRSRSSSSGSDAPAPMVRIPNSSSKSNSGAPRLVGTERSNESPPPNISLPPLMPISTSRRSSSERSRSNLFGVGFDEKRSVGLPDSFESAPLMTYVAAFALDTLPRQLYLHFLFRLPSIYFSRVSRIFEEAEMSLPEIKRVSWRRLLNSTKLSKTSPMDGSRSQSKALNTPSSRIRGTASSIHSRRNGRRSMSSRSCCFRKLFML